MTKRMWSCLLLTAALASSGCRMCCPSYDYCGPTEPGESNSETCGMDRRGSILGGMSTYVEGEGYLDEGTLIEEPQSAPLVAPPPPPKLDNHSARRSR